MTEVAPASEDSSSSSSYAPLGGFNNNNNYSSSTIINTPFSSPQSQQQPSSSSTTSSSASTTTASRKPRRFLQQKLDIPPRQFGQVNQVSVVKMSDKLTSTTTTTNNNNINTSTTNKVSTASSLCASTLSSVASANGNQKQVSPNSCLSLASSATTSPSLASRSSHNSYNNNNHSTNSDSAKTSPFFNCSSAASSCYSSSSSQMQESGGRTLSNISSIPSSLPSPQVTSANNVPQFGGSSDTNKTTQQQETQEDNEDNEDTFSATSGHFTASLVHPNIYLGAAIDANNAAELIARGIFFILNVAYECDFADSVMNCPQIQKKKINLRDTVQENIEPSFEEAFSFIDAAIEQNKKILVHCFMGASRSATIVIAYIMRKLAEKDLCEQVFVATRSSIISKHEQYEREETNKSPTMIDTLRIFPPPPTSASAVAVPPSSSTTTSAQAFPPTTSAAIENQQQQNQTVSFPVITTTTSDNSNSSSTSSSSYYFTALDQVQKVRPEILPNLAFCTALHKMDDELMLRSTAVVC